MTSDESGFSDVKDVVADALELPAAARAAYIETHCPDPVLHAEAVRLLQACEQAATSSGFDVPAAVFAAPIVADVHERSREVPQELVEALAGRYTIERELGRGGTATVYLALDERHGRRVALKLLRPELLIGDDPAHGALRFQREIEFAARLSHPHILPLHDSGETGGWLYYITPYVDGETLRDRLRRDGPPSLPESLRVLRDVTRALAHAHENGVVHRDIKPANILLNRDGDALVADFGVAKGVAAAQDPATPASQDVPEGALVLGTPAYMAPEQVTGSPEIDYRADLYALGAVAYELLTGAAPFAGRDKGAVLTAHLTEVPDPVAARHPDVPQRLAALVEQLLAKHPDDRPRNAGEVLRLLDAVETSSAFSPQAAGTAQATGTAQTAGPAKAAGTAGVGGTLPESGTDAPAALEGHLDSPPVIAPADTLGRRASSFLRRHRAAAIAAASGGLGALTVGAVLILFSGTSDRPVAATGLPVIAVGDLREPEGPDAPGMAATISDMLATNLGRVRDLQVVSNARMYEILARIPVGDSVKRSTAARQAGASQLLQGTLTSTGTGLRLALTRADVSTYDVMAEYEVEGRDAFDLVDRATVAIASDLGVRPGRLHLADVTTGSVVAYRFYEEGLRSFAVGDYRGAQGLFAAALTEDSTFAMAMHYALLSQDALFLRVESSDVATLLRLAEHAGERERLLVRAAWTPNTDPSGFAIAETLAVRYPAEPDGHYFLGRALTSSGRFLEALPHLRAVVAMDSLGLRGTPARCRACEALGGITGAYLHVDSGVAAERVARDWLSAQPQSARAWSALAQSLEALGRYEEALAAWRAATRLAPGHLYEDVHPATVRIQSGDLEEAERLLRELAGVSPPDVRVEALWFLTIALRNQGRHREALEALDDLVLVPDAPANEVRQHRAQALLEMGRAREAAELFGRLARVHTPPDSHPWVLARHRAWNLTHLAGALAALGDTTTLAGLADTIALWGNQSTFGRDWRLHHHARGLLMVARGRHEEAASSFRDAIFSPTWGYTRTNLELAGVLVELGRPLEAVDVLQPALRGGIEASNLYVTRTELHEALGRAWEAAGFPDSARVHHRRVAEAWRRADPPFQTRRADAAARLGAR